VVEKSVKISAAESKKLGVKLARCCGGNHKLMAAGNEITLFF